LKQSYVLDTNILLALIRGKALGESVDNAYGLRANLQRHVISIASQAELLVLADRNKWAQAKRDAVNFMFQSLVVLPIDGEALLDAYVQVSHADMTWHGGPRNMGKNDIWIAATAVSSGLPLLTTDKDFTFLNGNLVQVLLIDPDRKSETIH
jgi:tRNA(fMet)-specific endonuclease VapC